MMRIIKKAKDLLRHFWRRAHLSNVTALVKVEDQFLCHHLTIDGRSFLTKIELKNIVKVEAFKRDLYAYDLICLGFFGAGGEYVEIDEETPGWGNMMTHLREYFPGINEDRYSQVVLPAFAENRALIYQAK